MGQNIFFSTISSTKAGVGILFVLKESEKIKRQNCLSKANLSLDLFTFLQNDKFALKRQFCRLIFSLSFKTTTEYFLQLPLFICIYLYFFGAGEEICWIYLNFTALAFVGMKGWTNGQMVDGWLTNQRALHSCCVIIWSSKLLLNRIPTPALVLEMVLKKNVLSHSLWSKGLFVDRWKLKISLLYSPPSEWIMRELGVFNFQFF